MRALQRQLNSLEKRISDTRSEELKRKSCRAKPREDRAEMKKLERDAGMTFAELQRTQRGIVQGEMDAEQGKHEPASRPTCARGFESPREVRQPRASVPRPDPGGERLIDEAVESSSTPGVQVLYIRDMVDSPSHQRAIWPIRPTIRLPVHMIEIVNKLDFAPTGPVQTLGREPTSAGIPSKWTFPKPRCARCARSCGCRSRWRRRSAKRAIRPRRPHQDALKSRLPRR